MIIDICPLYSEIDTLLLRLHTHSFVDKFYIHEFSTDFQGNQKPLHYLANKELFKDFQDKIIYRNFDAMLGEGPHDKSRFMRDILQHELMSYPDDTIIINTDLDEILSDLSDYGGGVATLEMKWYVYFLNLFAGVWTNGSVCTVKDLRGKKLSELRYERHPILKTGWHFSWLGGAEVIKEKYLNFQGVEGWPVELTSENYVNDLLRRRVKFWDNKELQEVVIDETFPLYLQKNKGKLKKYIYEPEG